MTFSIDPVQRGARWHAVHSSGTIDAMGSPNFMRIRLIVAVAACATSAMAAPSSDAVHSTGCVNALNALHDVEDAVAASTPSGKAGRAADPRVLTRLAELKRAAARTCIGGDGTPSPAPQHLGRQPVSVAPVTVSPNPSRPRLARHTDSPPPPVSVVPLRSITSCDAVGCWASDGSRLQKLGPKSVGSEGVLHRSGVGPELSIDRRGIERREAAHDGYDARLA